MGRRWPRHHLPDVRRARRAAALDSRRLPGPAPVRPLRRVPRRSLGRHPHGAPAGRRMVEIWNGMPFLSPLWYRGPGIVFLHHVHAEMWGMVLPPTLARSATCRAPARPALLPPEPGGDPVGVVPRRDRRTCCAWPRARSPWRRRASTAGSPRAASAHRCRLVVAVGRLVPVKRFDALLRALADGEGRAARPAGGHHRRGVRAAGARGAAGRARGDRVGALPGHVIDDELVDVLPPGLGGRQQFTARGLGHDADRGGGVWHAGRGDGHRRPRRRRGRRESGLLVDDRVADRVPRWSRVLRDEVLRSRLSKGALARARWFTRDATARCALEALAGEVSSNS